MGLFSKSKTSSDYDYEASTLAAQDKSAVAQKFGVAMSESSGVVKPITAIASRVSSVAPGGVYQDYKIQAGADSNINFETLDEDVVEKTLLFARDLWEGSQKSVESLIGGTASLGDALKEGYKEAYAGRDPFAAYLGVILVVGGAVAALYVYKKRKK